MSDDNTPDLAAMSIIKDAFVSPNGAGGSFDKRGAYRLSGYRMQASEAVAFWSSSDVAQLVVDTPVREALRPGWSVSSGDDDITSQIQADLEDMHVDSVLFDAVRRARATGGAGILLLSQDADLSKPWSPASKLRGLLVFDATALSGTQDYITSLESPSFGLPAYYDLQPLGMVMSEIQRIHHTRIIRAAPTPISRQEVLLRAGWCQPVLETLAPVIKDFEVAYSEALGLLPDWAQGSITMSGLLRALTSTDTAGATAIAARYRLLDTSRSLHRPIPLDAGDSNSPAEKYERHPTPVAGLADLLDRAAQRLSMASHIPVPILMGQQPSGLGATGADSTRAWYAFIGTVQVDFVRPALEGILRAKWGTAEPSRWTVKFSPLWAPTDAEIAQTLLVTSQAYQILYNCNAISCDELRAKVLPELAEGAESAYPDGAPTPKASNEFKP